MHQSRSHRVAKRIAITVAAAAGLLLVFPVPALAYIDPASGSFILQMLLAVFFSLMFMLRKMRMKIRTTISSLFGKKPTDEQSQ